MTGALDRHEINKTLSKLAERSTDEVCAKAASLLRTLTLANDEIMAERNQLVRWRHELVEKCQKAGAPPGVHIADAYHDLRMHLRKMSYGQG